LSICSDPWPIDKRVPAPPGIFVVRGGMGIVVKCIEHMSHPAPTKIIMRSPNSEYQTYQYGAEDVNIVDRVVWTSKCPASAPVRQI
jgi:hypothetical protein